MSAVDRATSAAGAIQPQALTADTELRFNCYRGISCFNACCHDTKVQLTPWDIVRLRRHFHITSAEFVARYTIPYEMDHHGLPGLRLANRAESRSCIFLKDSGCSVYEDRPLNCRYYPLGNMMMRKKGEAKLEPVYFLLKETHCKGCEESKRQSIQDYLHKQGADEYESRNQPWIELLVKKRSSGPSVGTPSARSIQLFDMCSYDIDGFRDFLTRSGFTDMFAISPVELNEILTSDEHRFSFAMRFLRQVLFGEQSIPLKDGARETRIAARKKQWQQRRSTELSVQEVAEEQSRKASLDADQGQDDGGDGIAN